MRHFAKLASHRRTTSPMRHTTSKATPFQPRKKHHLANASLCQSFTWSNAKLGQIGLESLYSVYIRRRFFLSKWRFGQLMHRPISSVLARWLFRPSDASTDETGWNWVTFLVNWGIGEVIGPSDAKVFLSDAYSFQVNFAENVPMLNFQESFRIF